MHAVQWPAEREARGGVPVAPCALVVGRPACASLCPSIARSPLTSPALAANGHSQARREWEIDVRSHSPSLPPRPRALSRTTLLSLVASGLGVRPRADQVAQ